MKQNANLQGCIPQDIPYQCPVCEHRLTHNDIRGWGEYPQHTFRGAQKPDRKGFFFVCPRCFVKSCAHVPCGVSPQEFIESIFNRNN